MPQVLADTPNRMPPGLSSKGDFDLRSGWFRPCERVGRWGALGVILLVMACAGQPPAPPPPPAAQFQQSGLASVYAQRLHGRRTASGERYDRHAFTAAHRHLPFGTLVKVVNLKNGREVKVRINDRGPYRKGRIIDLSYAAAKQLEMLREGVTHVKINALHPE